MFGFLTSSSTTRLYRGRAPRQERLTILRAATHETELGDHDFCPSRSHYTDTDPTCRERAATAGIEPGTSSPGVARSTAEDVDGTCIDLFFGCGLLSVIFFGLLHCTVNQLVFQRWIHELRQFKVVGTEKIVPTQLIGIFRMKIIPPKIFFLPISCI